MSWSEQQVLSLASDAGTASKGQKLALSGKWDNLGHNSNTLWGECQGSGKKPYQVAIDLSGPAFKCSCPSRKFPCKHGIALFLLFLSDADKFRELPIPPSVSEWLEKRSQKAVKKLQEDSEEVLKKKQASREKRELKRIETMLEGLNDLDIWLSDIIRQGLASLEGRPYKYWHGIAARMIDSKIPGAANTIKRMAVLPGSGVDWPGKMLHHIADLFLLTRAFRNMENLPENTVQDIRSFAGINFKKETVLSLQGVQDQWIVLGVYERVEEELRVRTTWVFGQQTDRFALILDFAHGSSGFESHFVSGHILTGELVFFPGNYPLRALFKNPPQKINQPIQVKGFENIRSMTTAAALAYGSNPWLRRFPAIMQAMVPVVEKGNLFLIDSEKHYLKSVNQHLLGFKLMSLSGGDSVTVFGEWDGIQFMPLSAWSGNVFMDLKN